MKYIAAGFLLAIISMSTAEAALVDCGIHSISQVYIQSDRDDGHPHANNLFAVIDGAPCNGSQLIYMENTNPNYNAMLSGLMTTYTAGMRIAVWVNTSKVITDPAQTATQISIIALVK